MLPSFYYELFAIIIFSIFLSWVKSGSFINPVFFFVIWWGSFIFISSLNLVGIRTPSHYTFNLLLLALTMFSMGCITFLSDVKTPFNGYRYGGSIVSNILTANTKLKIFLYFQLVITAILLFFLNKGIALLQSLDPGTYRYLVYTDYGIFQGHKVLLNFILRPSIFVSAFLSIAGLFLGVIPKKFLIISFLNVFLYSIVILGRSSIIMIIICFFIGLLYYLIVTQVKIKKRYILLLVIPIVFVISLSIFRKSYASAKSGTDIIFDYFIWYLTGPFTALDYFLHIYKEGSDYSFTLIRSTFGGIEDIIEPIVKKIYPDFNQVVGSFTEILSPYRDFGGPATHHNSHYTMLFTFFMDAGVIGVIFFSYLLGVVNSLFYNSYKHNSNLFNFSILILITYLSMMGSTRWELMYSWPWLTVLVSYIMTKKFIFESKILEL